MTAETIASRFNPAGNNFDAIRLGAALVVLFSHCYSLTGAPWEPVSTYLHYGYGGTLAVAVFFVISGFLVARSVQTQELSSYLSHRMLRIIPALVLVTSIETVVIAPIFYDGPTLSYFHAYALDHMRNIFVFGEDPAIPNVFSRLHYPYVNGSLWTLPVESLFYLILPALMVLAAGRRRWLVLVVYAASLAAEPAARWYGLSDEQFGGFLFRTVRLFAVAQFACYFIAGVVAWSYRDRIIWSGGCCALCLFLLFAARDSMAAPIVLKLCLPYLVIYVGLHGGIGTALKRTVGDLSYGVYLFGYPAINTVISLTSQKAGPAGVFALAAPASLVLAWFSWRLVERPALRLKARPRLALPPATGLPAA